MICTNPTDVEIHSHCLPTNFTSCIGITCPLRHNRPAHRAIVHPRNSIPFCPHKRNLLGPTKQSKTFRKITSLRTQLPHRTRTSSFLHGWEDIPYVRFIPCDSESHDIVHGTDFGT